MNAPSRYTVSPACLAACLLGLWVTPCLSQAGPKITPQDLADDAETCSSLPVDQDSLMSPFIVVNARGNEIVPRGGFPLDEGDDLTVYVRATKPVAERIYARRTSRTRDLDGVSFAGIQATGSVAMTEECALSSTTLRDFAPPEGKIVFEVYNDSTGALERLGNEIAFPVRTLYRGAVSFGPLASKLPDLTYLVVEDAAGDSLLVQTGSDYRLDYALTFTYYLTGPKTRDGGWSLGASLSIPVTGALGENVYVGLSLDYNTYLMLHAGIRGGQVERIIKEQEDLVDSPVRSDFRPTTESQWKPALAFGIAINAAAATQAFGNAVAKIGQD